MSGGIDNAAVDRIMDEQGRQPSAVIAILQGIQERYRYLPEEVFPYLSRRIGVSEAALYSVAAFYENFSLEPKGKFVIRVCDGTGGSSWSCCSPTITGTAPPARTAGDAGCGT